MREKGKLEHRAVMEGIVGRELRTEEHVHHKDRNRKNNAPENLVLLTHDDHSKLHSGNVGVEKPDGKAILFGTLSVVKILSGEKTQFIKPASIDEEEARNKRKHYKIGDVLYVREKCRESKCYALDGWHCSRKPQECGIWQKPYMYEADCAPCTIVCKYKPMLYTPRNAIRIFLRLTDVRFAQLQDITEEDAIAEGFEGLEMLQEWWDMFHVSRGFGWHTNPWVYLYTFERIEGGTK